MRFSIFITLSLTLLSSLSAQECQPDPGPALFLEDFGSGAGLGPPLASGTTSFLFGSTDTCHYLVSNTTNINQMEWHNGPDHTEGDTDGYMLIFNACSAPDTFYQRAFTDLCPNTDYIFIYHMANLSQPTSCIGFSERPNIRTSIIDPVAGVTQLTSTTGEIWYSSFLVWREYTLRFRTEPDQNTVLIQLTNEAPGGCGNDLAFDDLSLHLCNVEVEQSFDFCDLPGGGITVGTNTYTEAGTYFDEIPVPNSCNDTLVTTILSGEQRRLPATVFTICEGDSLEIDGRSYTTNTTLIDTLPGPSPDCPLFQPTEIIVQPTRNTTQDIALCLGDSVQVGSNWYEEAGTYVDSLQSDSGCDSVVITNISRGDITVEVIPNTVDLDFGDAVQLMSTVSLSDSYSLAWQPPEAFSCQDCPYPVFQPTASGLYRLTATDLATGCAAETTIEARVRTCDQVFVPNAFSPNGDDVNDRFSVFAEACFIRVVSWYVFDRWGGLVYEAKEQPLNGSFNGWDGQAKGQLAERGIYTYRLILERVDGTITTIQGEVMLLP